MDKLRFDGVVVNAKKTQGIFYFHREWVSHPKTKMTKPQIPGR